MTKKVQSQLLVSEPMRDQADVLALITQNPRAEVYRMALVPGLKDLEQTYTDGIAELDGIAEIMRMTRTELATRALKDKYTLADLRGLKRYPTKR